MRTVFLLAVFAWLWALTGPVIAQHIGSPDWLRQVWQEASAWEPPANTFFRYRIEAFVHVDPEEVARLEAEVRGHPEHPARRRLRQLKDMQEAGSPLVSERRIWWGNDAWRFSRDTPTDPSDPFHDVVVTRSWSWSLHADSLSIADPANAPEGLDHRRYEPTLRMHLSQFVWGELGLGADGPLAFGINEAHSNGDGWTGVAISRNGARERIYHGRIVEGRMPVVEEVRMRRSDDAPAFEGERTVFSDWSVNNHIGRPIAGIVEGFAPDGSLSWRMTLQEVRPVSRQELSDVLRVPQEGMLDPVRGLIEPRVVTDARPIIQSMRIRDESGVRVEPIPGVIGSSPRTLIRVLGWVVAGGVLFICALVWIVRWWKATV